MAVDDDTEDALTLWSFTKVGAPLEKSDVIAVLGSADPRTADHGAALFHEGWAPWIVFSGGRGRLTRSWSEPEAVVFAERAVAAGVPRDRILLETRSGNTGENLRFSRDLLEERSLPARTWILVHTPYMERRALATFAVAVPDARAIASSPPIGFDEFPADLMTRRDLIERLVGHVQRLMDYPALGFQAPVDIPGEVRDAWRRLIDAGYDRLLVSRPTDGGAALETGPATD